MKIKRINLYFDGKKISTFVFHRQARAYEKGFKQEKKYYCFLCELTPFITPPLLSPPPPPPRPWQDLSLNPRAAKRDNLEAIVDEDKNAQDV